MPLAGGGPPAREKEGEPSARPWQAAEATGRGGAIGQQVTVLGVEGKDREQLVALSIETGPGLHRRTRHNAQRRPSSAGAPHTGVLLCTDETESRGPTAGHDWHAGC